MAKKINNAIEKMVCNEEFLGDWLSTATYGNYNFVVSVHKDTSDEVYNKAREDSPYRESTWSRVLLGGGSLSVYEVEEDEYHKMTLENILEGFLTFMMKYPKMYAELVEDGGDLISADGLLQCIIFGDIIYG